MQLQPTIHPENLIHIVVVRIFCRESNMSTVYIQYKGLHRPAKQTSNDKQQAERNQDTQCFWLGETPPNAPKILRLLPTQITQHTFLLQSRLQDKMRLSITTKLACWHHLSSWGWYLVASSVGSFGRILRCTSTTHQCCESPYLSIRCY